MVNFDLDNCLRIIPNRYELILLAKTRANEIFLGSEPLLQKLPHEKVFFTALKEISEGLHDYYTLNEKTLINIRNSIAGISAQPSSDSNVIDKFDDDSLFAQAFQNIEVDGEDFGNEIMEIDDLDVITIDEQEDRID